jgi:hypothetical protein
MKKLYSLIAIILLSAAAVSAQTEAELKRYFEGRRVVLKIDMPATTDGVNVYPERAQPLNYGEYAGRLKRQGTAIRSGESKMITGVKVRGNHVEFRLGGGDVTPGGATGASAQLHASEKSRRVKRLEEERKALQAGSRFNIHFGAGDGARALTPGALVEALRNYVDFANLEGGAVSSYLSKT